MERISVKVLVSVAVLLAVTAMVCAPAFAEEAAQKSAIKKTDKADQKTGEACPLKAKCGEKLAKISAALKAAKSAADAGDAKTASAKIAWAQERVDELKKFTSTKSSQCKLGKDKPEGKKGNLMDEKSAEGKDENYLGESADKGGFVNATCPIMGRKINPAKVTASHTRSFDGKKVALCCGRCPPQWNALSDADKRAKLKKAM